MGPSPFAQDLLATGAAGPIEPRALSAGVMFGHAANPLRTRDERVVPTKEYAEMTAQGPLHVHAAALARLYETVHAHSCGIRLNRLENSGNAPSPNRGPRLILARTTETHAVSEQDSQNSSRPDRFGTPTLNVYPNSGGAK